MKSKGFTLIEMAVVLGIIAILAAIMTPLVTSYIDQARITRATADTSSIAKAYLLYYRDTGYWPIYNTSALASAGNPSMNCQVSGTAATMPSTSNANWGTSQVNCTGANVALIRSYLNVNSIGFATGNPAGGATSYRGPYLDGLDAKDPWNNAYVVNSKALSTNDQLHWAFAISAGPNGILESDPWQFHTTTVVTSGDDIVALIR